MKLSDVEIESWSIVPYTEDKPNKVYYNNGVYAKVWGIDHIDPYTTQDGLTFTFHGFSRIQTVALGLINDTTCPAFIDTLYTNDGVCCGYLTAAGTTESVSAKTFRFIDQVVNLSIGVGYLLRDVTSHNIVYNDGVPSLIDIDQPPININEFAKLAPMERIVWERLLANGTTFTNTIMDPVCQYYLTKIKQVLQ